MKFAPVFVLPVAVEVILLPISCAAQNSEGERSAPHFSGQEPHEAQEIFRKLEGSVCNIDTNGMTLTIRQDDKPATFKITLNTGFVRNDNRKAKLDDIEVGQKVEVIIKGVHGRPDEVVSVNIKSK